VVAPPVRDTSGDERLIMDDIRASLRGRSAEELSRTLNVPVEAVDPLIEGLLRARKIVRRGTRFYQR
jgi:hypothetical protein